MPVTIEPISIAFSRAMVVKELATELFESLKTLDRSRYLSGFVYPGPEVW
jgi:hypothetical protein